MDDSNKKGQETAAGSRPTVDPSTLYQVLEEIDRLRNMVASLAEESQTTRQTQPGEANSQIPTTHVDQEVNPPEISRETPPANADRETQAAGASDETKPAGISKETRPTKVIQVTEHSSELPSDLAELLEVVKGTISDPKALESRYTVVLAMVESEKGKKRQSIVSAASETDLGKMLVSDEDLVRFATAFTNSARLKILRALSHDAKTWADLTQGTGLVGGQLYHHLKELIYSGFVVQEDRNSYNISPRVGKPAYLGMNLLARTIQRATERWAVKKEEQKE